MGISSSPNNLSNFAFQGNQPFTCGLFFSINVYENVAFALRTRRPRWSPEQIERVTMEHLEKVGLSAGLCRQAFTFYETCDVLRFAPSPVRDATDLAAAAEELILAVESETWSSHQS